MTDVTNNGQAENNGYISLADLAGANTDDIAVLFSRLPAAGVFRVRCEEVNATQPEPTADYPAPSINYTFKLKILGVHGVIDKTLDTETLVGKGIPDRFRIYTATAQEAQECVGLLKGRFATVGLEHVGAALGGDGQVTGWVDNAINAEFDVRVRHAKINDQTRVYIDWLKPEQAAA